MKSSRTRSGSSSSNHNTANSSGTGERLGTSLSEINDFLHPSVSEIPSFNDSHFATYGPSPYHSNMSMSATYIPSPSPSSLLHRPRGHTNDMNSLAVGAAGRPLPQRIPMRAVSNQILPSGIPPPPPHPPPAIPSGVPPPPPKDPPGYHPQPGNSYSHSWGRGPQARPTLNAGTYMKPGQPPQPPTPGYPPNTAFHQPRQAPPPPSAGRIPYPAVPQQSTPNPSTHQFERQDRQNSDASEVESAGAGVARHQRSNSRNVLPQVNRIRQSPVIGGANPPHSPDAARVWTLERVLNWLGRHGFAPEWQEAFKKLNIHSADFLDLGDQNSQRLSQEVLPEVLRLSGKNANRGREGAAAEKLHMLVNRMLNINIEGPTSPPANPQLVQRTNQPDSAYGTDSAGSYQVPWNNNGETLHGPAFARNDASKSSLGSIESLRHHSPSNSDHSFHHQRESPLSPPSPSNMPVRGKHNKSDSVGSTSRFFFGMHRNRDKEDKKSAGSDSKEHSGFPMRLRRKPRIGDEPNQSQYEEDDVNVDSPTSPRNVRNPNFIPAAANQSDTSLDRYSEASAISDQDRMKPKPKFKQLHLQQQQQAQQIQPRRQPLWVFVTRDGRNFVLQDLSGIGDVDSARKCLSLAVDIADWDAAQIFLTQPGMTEHNEPLTDQMLWLCRDQADRPFPTMFFIQQNPASATSPTAATFMGGISERMAQMQRNPSPPHLDSNVSTLTQEKKDRLKQTMEAGQPNLNEIRDRLERFRKTQDTGPNISITEPFTPRQPPNVPWPSIEPSPHDIYPGPNSAHPGSWDEHDDLHAELMPQSPVPSSPKPSATVTRIGGDDYFEDDAASEEHKRLLEAKRRQREQFEKQRISKEEELKRKDEKIANDGFTKITRKPRPVIDFDNRRASPYEERKMSDVMAPLRQAPRAPDSRHGSLSKKTAETVRQLANEEFGRRQQGTLEMKERRKLMEEARRNSGSDPSSGIAGAVVGAGALSGGIVAGAAFHGGSQSNSPMKETASPSITIDHYDNHASGSPKSPRSLEGSWGKSVINKISSYIDGFNGGSSASSSMDKKQLSLIIPGSNSPPIEEVAPLKVQRPTPAPAPQSPYDDDSDSDDGLFAVPLQRSENSTPKKDPKIVSPNSPRPSLTVSTESQMKNDTRRSVTFKTTPTTQSAPHSAKSPDFPDPDCATLAPAQSRVAPSPVTSNHAHSPADYGKGINRRNSFAQDSDVWAFRPPTEALIDNLDDFFPNIDLDMPLDDASPPPSPSGADRYRLTDVPDVPPIPEDLLPAAKSSNNNRDSVVFADISTLDKSYGNPNIKPPPIVSVARRSVNRDGGLGRTRSIRESVNRAHENRKRQTILLQQKAEESKTAADKQAILMRRKSTKMFGAKLIELKPEQGRKSIKYGSSGPSNTSQQPIAFQWIKGQLIGKGTYGRVYLGLNTTTKEFLAVKQVEVNPNASAGESERQKEMIAALNQEIETMQHLDHINIVQYLGCETKEMHMSIFLEYIEGGSVGSCLRKHGKFQEPVIRSLTRQVLSGLEYLHRQGILHRDLKADNILLDLNGVAKISDFGISKKSQDIYGNDASNSMQGSVFWMAPEVIRPEGQGYSAKIDIWSLGCVVLEMFAGRRPWSKEEAIGAIYKLGNERKAPPIPEDVESVISPEAVAFLADCHMSEPKERPTANTLLEQHPFCALDPTFDFTKTTLYEKLREKSQFQSRISRRAD